MAIYYAHSLLKYDSTEECIELTLIHGWKHWWNRVYNPNNDTLQAIGKVSGQECMEECYRIIRSKQIHCLVFSAYKGHVGRGVYEEISVARQCGKDVYIIEDRCIKRFDMRRLELLEIDWKIKYALIKKG